MRQHFYLGCKLGPRYFLVLEYECACKYSHGVPSAVRQAREAVLDSQLLVLATDLGKEKASQLHAEGSAFDTTAFAEHLVSLL